MTVVVEVSDRDRTVFMCKLTLGGRSSAHDGAGNERNDGGELHCEEVSV